jgi:hypothetical protein
LTTATRKSKIDHSPRDLTTATGFDHSYGRSLNQRGF